MTAAAKLLTGFAAAFFVRFAVKLQGSGLLMLISVDVPNSENQLKHLNSQEIFDGTKIGVPLQALTEKHQLNQSCTHGSRLSVDLTRVILPKKKHLA